MKRFVGLALVAGLMLAGSAAHAQMLVPYRGVSISTDLMSGPMAPCLRRRRRSTIMAVTASRCCRRRKSTPCCATTASRRSASRISVALSM